MIEILQLTRVIWRVTMRRSITIILSIIMIIYCVLPAYANNYEDGIPVPEFKGSVVDIEDKVDIMGYSKGAELLQNSIFTDTTNHWGKRAITRMSAQSVIKGYGEHKFKPDNYITRQEVIASLVRMKGLEGTVQENISTQGQGLTSAVINDVWAEGYIIEAGTLGILTGNEDGNFRAYTTREEIAVWVARLLELDPVYDNLEIIYTFDDWREISFGNIGAIEAVLQERILQGDTNGNFNPKDYINRAELTSILNNISDRLYEDRNLQPYFGQVINIQRKTSREIGSLMDETIVTVKNIDGTITSLISKNSAKGILNEFVVYKNGIVSGSSSLSIGDEVEYIVRDEQVIYVEVYNDGSILEKVKESSLKESNLRTYFGKITAISTEDYWSMENNKVVNRFRVRNIDGQSFDIVVETDKNTGIKNDVIVYKNDRVGGSSLLSQGDDIEYIVKDNKSIVYVNVISLDKQVVSGTVKTVSPQENKITIVDYDDDTRIFGVVPYAAVTINLRPAQLSDLKYGQEVTLNINNGLVTSITGETFMDEPGYIPSNGKVRSGKIQYLGRDSLTIEYGDDTSESFNVHDDTTIIKEDRSISFKDLREGDKIKLYFDNIYSSDISKIEVEGEEQLIKKIYKGELQKVDLGDDEITLTNPEVLRNSEWDEVDDYKITLELDDSADIFYNGYSIDVNDLKDDHINDDIYVVLEDSYGRDKGIKLVVKKGSERLYNDTIDDINYVADKLELDNGKNISYDEGTIIVKDDRLVSSSSLEEDLTALVVSGYSGGNYMANVIQLGSTGYKIFENIYVGKIDAIDSDEFEIKYDSELDENEWDDVSSSSSKTLSFDYSDDTFIVDITDGYDEISPDDFFHDGYSDEEDEDYFTFIVTDDDRNVIAMTLREDELFEDTDIDSHGDIEDKLEKLLLTRGSVTEVDELRERLEMHDPYDWSSFYDEWKENNNDQYVDIGETLFIKEGEAISMEDVEEDDIIYILRDDEDAIIIFVE